MAFEALKENLFEADINIQSYAKSSEEYIKLKSFKALMIGITFITKLLIISALVGMSLLLLSLALAILLGEILNNLVLGFLIVGLFYALVGLIAYFLRNKLNAPLLKKFSNYYFKKI
ncbi:hypothetical protein JBL43_15670 [Aureibaculum sp. A20]|uniref:Competence protein n=1 Tax=Aureibaculum flavum TaxID=2795986 RepID=A0ABS0WUP4_9FLAO|nr:hypothetical protein [Aureibaculum flavum]MBJ2175691.1 hypothetical protein [Aureibaculum flavum]